MKFIFRSLMVLFAFLAAVGFAGVTIVSESKQPFEELTESVDFSDRLGTGDNVASCTVFARDMGGNDVDNTILGWDNTMISGQEVSYIRKGGEDGKKYRITLRCTSDNGVKLEHDVIFTVQEY